jgi:hypothetical protein
VVSGEAVALLGLLAEPDRLRVAAALTLGARTVDEVEDRTGLDRRQVTRALERLTAGGLVGRDGADGLRLRAERLKEAVRAAAADRAEEPAVDPTATGAAAAVLRTFIRDGRLVQIPANHTKRGYVLDFLASQFEPGRTYPERVVNEELQKWHPDSAALRRYLVEEEFLERRDGIYWRAGGTVKLS